MAKPDNTEAKSGSFTPHDLADPSRHQQSQIFERKNRPQRSAPGGKAQKRFEAGEDMLAQGEQSLGQAAGRDTSGAVAPPAESNRPGSATKLGGTPGANAMRSDGRDTDH